MNEFINKLIERLEEYKDSHLIERNSLLAKHCEEKESFCAGSDCTLCVWDKAIEIINQLAEEYKARKGEWRFDISGAGHYNCSVCGGRGDFYGKYNYCPHCGSKMNDAEEAKAYNESVKGDLISRSAVLRWINKQIEEVTKKQVAGTKESIFTRENLVDMQRCLSTFATFINNQPTDYNDGWIPCSESLPDDFMSMEYLTTVKGRFYSEINYYCVVNHKWYSNERTTKEVNVTAWQPLPPAYQPKGE